MPKGHFDWFTVATLWLGAAIIAIKTGDVPLIQGAPAFFASPLWGYVPFGLVTLYGVRALLRNPNDPVRMPLMTTTTPNEATQQSENSKVLPKHLSDEYISLKISGCTDLQEYRFLRQFIGKFIELELRLSTIGKYNKWIRAICFAITKDQNFSPIAILFESKWEDHLQHLKNGDVIRLRAKISDYGGSVIFDHGEPI